MDLWITSLSDSIWRRALLLPITSFPAGDSLLFCWSRAAIQSVLPPVPLSVISLLCAAADLLLALTAALLLGSGRVLLSPPHNALPSVGGDGLLTLSALTGTCSSNKSVLQINSVSAGG